MVVVINETVRTLIALIGMPFIYRDEQTRVRAYAHDR